MQDNSHCKDLQDGVQKLLFSAGMTSKLSDVLWGSVTSCIKRSPLIILEFLDAEVSVGKGRRGLVCIPHQTRGRFGCRYGMTVALGISSLCCALPAVVLEHYF